MAEVHQNGRSFRFNGHAILVELGCATGPFGRLLGAGVVGVP